MPTRTIDFLENTAKAMPWRDVKHSGVMVTFNPIDIEFYYYQVFQGGSTKGLTRDAATELFSRNQADK